VPRTAKKATAFSLIFLFALGVWCASLAAPGQSVASATQRCPQDSLALGKVECNQPNFMCPFGVDQGSFSGIAIISPRTHEFPETVLSPIGEAVTRRLFYEIFLADMGAIAANFHFPEKVPIHLLNSVLNL